MILFFQTSLALTIQYENSKVVYVRRARMSESESETHKSRRDVWVYQGATPAEEEEERRQERKDRSLGNS